MPSHPAPAEVSECFSRTGLYRTHSSIIWEVIMGRVSGNNGLKTRIQEISLQMSVESAPTVRKVALDR